MADTLNADHNQIVWATYALIPVSSRLTVDGLLCTPLARQAVLAGCRWWPDGPPFVALVNTHTHTHTTTTTTTTTTTPTKIDHFHYMLVIELSWLCAYICLFSSLRLTKYVFSMYPIWNGACTL